MSLNTKISWKIKGKTLVLEKPAIMGIVNVTPDSFYDGGLYEETEKAVEKALSLVEEGADVIDIGGESTRPGSQPVTEEEEKRRVLPVIEKLAAKTTVPISCDTYKSSVATAALQSGASIINDISAFRFDSDLIQVIKEQEAGVVLMHMSGTPATMQQSPYYQDVISEIRLFLKEIFEKLVKTGIKPESIVLDPGIGFGKRVQDNLRILRNASAFQIGGRPVLIGASRKSFIGAISNVPPQQRLPGSLAAALIALESGAFIFRVHDVRETRLALEVAWAILNS